jgi:hypothetical protein
MNLSERLDAFGRLRQRLLDLDESAADTLCRRAGQHNGWFTAASVRDALQGVARYLEPQALREWSSAYPIPDAQRPPKTVGLVMAGNIPLVGFHDFLCVLLSGHRLRAKLSSQDPFLPKELTRILLEEAPGLSAFVAFEERMNGVDAIIATGSDNTARHFNHYFRQVPRIIRRNRSSAAVLTGHETEAELQALGQDICQYFGLGCRSISALLVPEGYDFMPLLRVLEGAATACMDLHKYVNNYEYNKSIMLVNGVHHFDTGGLMLTESKALASPISVVHYRYYRNPMEAEAILSAQQERLQCVVGQEGSVAQAIPFGQAQCPGVGDYADGIDTMEWLLRL